MKKGLFLFTLIMICCANIVFAVSTYIDPQSGVELNLPDGWEEIYSGKEDRGFSAHFKNSDETVIFTYCSEDYSLMEGLSKEEAEELRNEFDMSALEFDEIKKEYVKNGFSNIEKVTFNGVDYVKYEAENMRDTFNGQEYIPVQLIHFRNGYSYSFSTGRTMYEEYYDDFKFIMENVKYPYSDNVNTGNIDFENDKSSALKYYNLLLKGPGVYIPVFILLFLFTIIIYGAFPLILACTRKKVITRLRYGCYCYTINFLINISSSVMTDEINGSPHLFWTTIFYAVGISILKRRRVLQGYQPVKVENAKENMQEIKIVIFDKTSGKTRTETKIVDMEKLELAKLIDNDTCYAVEEIRDGKKTRSYCNKTHWDKESEKNILID